MRKGAGLNGIKIRPVWEYFALLEGVAGVDMSCSQRILSFPGNLRGNPESNCWAGASFQALFEHFAGEFLPRKGPLS